MDGYDGEKGMKGEPGYPGRIGKQVCKLYFTKCRKCQPIPHRVSLVYQVSMAPPAPLVEGAHQERKGSLVKMVIMEQKEKRASPENKDLE